MDKTQYSVSVRRLVEFALLSGDLTPGSQLARMREGMLGHQARQRLLPGARAEVAVRGQVQGDSVMLEISGRIDALYERDGLPVVEEIKLASVYGAPEQVVPVHRAQALCYAYLLGVPEAVVRVLYVRPDGSETGAFEETMFRAALEEAFGGLTAPYLAMLEGKKRWRALRDVSIRRLDFPFQAYRTGQREMAVQVYWAVKSRKRLFVQAPTGSGKTAATIFPALKALCEGLTGQIFYLTARGTARENATAALERMREKGLRLRVLSLTAKGKICPYAVTAQDTVRDGSSAFRCNLLDCPCAHGFFDRLPGALADMRTRDDWSREAVEAVASAHTVCPFEFALSLCEEADAVICDYNYAFDPGVRIRRVFQSASNLTLLIDEAHNLPDRARDMLSAELDSAKLRELRRASGKSSGRKAPLYRSLTELIRLLEAQTEGTQDAPPQELEPLLTACADAALEAGRLSPVELWQTLVQAQYALESFDERYATLTKKHGKIISLTLFCMDPAPHLAKCTEKLRGCAFFSATLTPLSAWRDMMGGSETDGLLSLSSPFPWENLLVLQLAVSTRYRTRSLTASAVADAIVGMTRARAGNYLACFPSYAYLDKIQKEIEVRYTDIVLHVQHGDMNEAERAAYLDAFAPRDTGAMLGLVVMGGAFGEGIDLAGERLMGVAIVGVGLPQVCPERELLRGFYQQKFSDGFAYAYRYPGMNKVMQAVGRVIRTDTDRGVALLIDDRFQNRSYASLMPPWWAGAPVAGSAMEAQRQMGAFWNKENKRNFPPIIE